MAKTVDEQLLEAQTSNAALVEHNRRLAAAVLGNEARDFVHAELLKETTMVEAMRSHIEESMRGTCPTAEDGTLDTKALGVALKARTAKELAYVESLKPAKSNKIGGLGGKAPAVEGEALYEALKDSYMRADSEMTEAAAEKLARIASRGV